MHIRKSTLIHIYQPFCESNSTSNSWFMYLPNLIIITRFHYHFSIKYDNYSNNYNDNYEGSSIPSHRSSLWFVNKLIRAIHCGYQERVIIKFTFLPWTRVGGLAALEKRNKCCTQGTHTFKRECIYIQILYSYRATLSIKSPYYLTRLRFRCIRDI